MKSWRARRSLLLRPLPAGPYSSASCPPARAPPVVLGGNFPTSLAARKSITGWSHFSMESSSETFTCRHLPALHPVAFPLLSRAPPAGLSIGCSGGRDVPASGPSCFCRHTSSICHHLGVRNIFGTSPLVRVRTSVGRTWLPEASHCSSGWVTCFQLCLSVYSRGAY
jgi:hypothetical protein